MHVPKLHRRLIAPLAALGIPYMVTDGVAAIVYGEPRLTNAVDVVVRLTTADARRLSTAYPTGDYYVPPAESLDEEASRGSGGHFNVLHLPTAMRADCYVAGDDELAAWGLERRRRIPLDAEEMWLAPIEYVIVKKLEYFKVGGSERHLRDVARMLRISGNLVDRDAVQHWIARLDLSAQWDAARTYDE
jgi:hypothetical protein